MTFWEVVRRVGALCTQTMLVLLIINFGIGAYSSFQQSQRTYEEQKGRTDKEREEAAQKIGAACDTLPVGVQPLRDCVSSGVEAYEKQANTDRDLEAQQQMSFWAQAQFWLGATGTLLSAFGLFFVWQSLKQTREAITTDRQVGHAQVRAYISIDLDVPKIFPGRIPQKEFTIRNTGQSPAYRLAYIAGFDVLPNPLPSGFGHIGGKAPGQPEPKLSVAAGGSTIGEALGLEALTDKHFDAFFDGTSALYVFVRAFYEDVFGKSHETSFCGRIDFELLAGRENENPRPWLVRMYMDQDRSYSD